MINYGKIIETMVGLAAVIAVVLLAVLALDYDPLLQSASSQAVLCGMAAVIGLVAALINTVARNLQSEKETKRLRRGYHESLHNTPHRFHR